MNEKIAGMTRQDAQRRRDEGIALAQLGAEKLTPGWSSVALAYLAKFLRDHDEPFLTEDVRVSAFAWGLREGGKAWGQVMRRAKKEGLIIAVGYAPAKTSNLSPKVLWRKA